MFAIGLLVVLFGVSVRALNAGVQQLLLKPSGSHGGVCAPEAVQFSSVLSAFAAVCSRLGTSRCSSIENMKIIGS